MNDQEDPESFAARQERQKAKGINGNGMGMPLAMAARTWPTPTTRDHKGGGEALIRSDGKVWNDMLDWVAEKWATPRATDAEKGSPNQSFISGGTPLPAQAAQWATPQARLGDGRSPQAKRWGDPNRHGGWNLDDQVAAVWATPRVEIARALGNPKHITPTRGNGNLEDQVVAVPSFRRDLPITTDGDEPSHIRRTLNPLFVEWLMGWPPGWTFLGLTPPASSGCACSATALSRFRADMRSALSSLGTPPAAPPEQPSFL